ncbi:MAG TPA: hypothetical protein PK705_07770 [Clostridia bacterium]|mgnify:CR=1 FL=1|nr:hypothetical protein [Clostridia bacterium]
MSFGMYSGFIGFALRELDKFKEAREIQKKKIWKEWDKTYDMPRKMKKRRRKELNFEWALMTYDPFETDLFI